MSRVVVVGAGVGGLAAAIRLAEAGHDVTVLEATSVPGGKAGRLERDGFAFDTGPSLVTMPHVLTALTGDRLELLPVEPVTRYRFADGTQVDVSADPDASRAALDAWSPGAGDDWARLLRICTAMWHASWPLLQGEPPWPPRRPGPDDPPPDPRALLAVRPWHTLATLAASITRDPRLRMVIERFATYAGADPRRAPAALVLAGYVEHAFGAWHPRGGVYAIVRTLADRAREAGATIAYDTPATGLRRRGRAVAAVDTPSGPVPADHVVWSGDAEVLDGLLGRGRPRERSLSGYVLLLGARDAPGEVHHEIAFPADYGAEFDDVFRGRPVRDPTLYVSTSSVTDPGEAPPGGANRFVLVNAPSGLEPSAFAGYADHLLARLAARGLATGELLATRTPHDLERESGAAGGAIYGVAPHGRLGTLRRPGPRVRGIPNLLRAGGTAHPGGGLPMVALGGELAARIIVRENKI